MPAPIPFDAPVTTATFPFSFPFFIFVPFIFLEGIKSVHKQTDVGEVIHRSKDRRSYYMRSRCYLSASQTLIMLYAEVAQPWVPIRAAPKRPMIFSLRLLDRQIVDAGVATPHQTMIIKLPILITV